MNSSVRRGAFHECWTSRGSCRNLKLMIPGIDLQVVVFARVRASALASRASGSIRTLNVQSQLLSLQTHFHLFFFPLCVVVWWGEGVLLGSKYEAKGMRVLENETCVCEDLCFFRSGRSLFWGEWCIWNLYSGTNGVYLGHHADWNQGLLNTHTSCHPFLTHCLCSLVRVFTPTLFLYLCECRWTNAFWVRCMWEPFLQTLFTVVYGSKIIVSSLTYRVISRHSVTNSSYICVPCRTS